MKKKVRVYKPGGEAAQPTQEQVVNYIAQRMTSDDFDGDVDALKEELAQAGIAEDAADEYITYVSDELGLGDNEAATEDEQLTAEEQARLEEEQAMLAEQEAAAEEDRQARINEMYNTDIDMSATEDTPEDEESYMQYGGSKPSKRSFINKYTKLAKKQMGGNTPSPGPDDVLNGREAHVKGFLGAVARTAQDAQLREEAENQYNAIYGAPQMGAFQDGGIHQEEIDPENPLHHLSTYGADTRHIFSDDMYTQNDVAAMEQYGGNTGQGLYRFIGGGDNESADEMYQDADLDYNQYAKRGGALNKYQKEGETTENWKAKYDDLVKQNTLSQQQQQMLQQMMLQKFMENPGFMAQNSYFTSPIRRGRNYNEAIGSPYYNEAGKRISIPNVTGRPVTSIDVTKRGIFGRPKKFTVNYGNYGNNTSDPYGINTKSTNTSGVNKSDISNNTTNNNQPIASWMMNSNIPGIRGIGSHLYKTTGYEGNNVDNQSVQAPSNSFNPFGNDVNADLSPNDKAIQEQLNKIPKVNTTPTSNSIAPTFSGSTNPYGISSNTINAISNYPFSTPDNQKQIEAAKKIQETINMGQNSGLSRDEQEYQDFLIRHQGAPFREYGGPVDYTQFAYGGDISIPELYRAQGGVQVPFDPNDNNMNFSNLTDFANSTKPEVGRLPESMQQKNYTIDPNQVNPDTISQDFKNKNEWIIDPGATLNLVGNATANILETRDTNRKQNKLLENTTAAQNLYGVNDQYNKGTYDPNSGLFRPDEMGFNGVVKYGGGVYAMGGNTMDDEEDVQYMTQEEIDDFIANGGELEYL